MTTVPSSHLTLAWKSAPYARWSYRNLRRASDSSLLRPTISRVTAAPQVSCCSGGEGTGKTLTLGVDVEGLFARGRVSAHNGVVVDDGLAALDAVSGSGGIHLLDARVRGSQAVQTLTEQRAEAVVRLDGVDKERVAARVGLVEDV
jgi:hypothetical protein